MPSSFKNIGSTISTIDTSAADVYTAPSGTKAVVHALYVSNKSPVFYGNVDIKLTTDGGTNYFHVGKSLRINPEDTLLLDKPLNLETGDKLRLVSLIDSTKDTESYEITTVSGQTLFYSGGTGNVFYLDGSRQAAGASSTYLNLTKGRSYIFYQDSLSNDTHPAYITTSQSDPTGNIVSSGVKYYLDGVATTSTNYLNNSTTYFDKASTRQVKFTPQSTGTFYVACWNHGIGMGFGLTVTDTNPDLEVYGSILEVS